MKHECKRCGLCCMGRGDLAGYGDDDGTDCSAMEIVDGTASCLVQSEKRGCCDDYPLPYDDHGLCEQQLRFALVLARFKGIKLPIHKGRGF